LQPVALSARTLPNMLVMGRQLCGKTTTLAAIGQAITQRFTPEQAQITVIDPKTTLIGKIRGPHVRAYAYTADDIDAVIAELAAELRDRLPPSGLTQEELLNLKAWDGPRQFVLIDDEHELRPRLPGNWAGQVVMNPFLQKMTGSRSPTLFMDNDPANVKVFARISAHQLPPGRGLLVTTEGDIEGVLVGTPESGE
jgi:hypothetical protein